VIAALFVQTHAPRMESGLNFRADEQDSKNTKSNDFDAQERTSKLDLKDII